MKWNPCFGLLGLAGIMVLAGTLLAQPPASTRYKVVPFSELYRDTEGKSEKGKEIPPPLTSIPMLPNGIRVTTNPPPNTGVLVNNLNRLGKTGWEAMASGNNGLLFRMEEKKAWTYRVLKVPASALNGKSTDDEVLLLALETLAGQGWEPCLGILNEANGLLLKRSFVPDYKKEKDKEDFKFKDEKKGS